MKLNGSKYVETQKGRYNCGLSDAATPCHRIQKAQQRSHLMRSRYSLRQVATALETLGGVRRPTERVSLFVSATMAAAAADTSQEGKTDIWKEILAISSKKDVVPPKNLIVLGTTCFRFSALENKLFGPLLTFFRVGDAGSGASSLLAHLQGNEDKDKDKTASLRFSYLDVFAGDEEGAFIGFRPV